MVVGSSSRHHQVQTARERDHHHYTAAPAAPAASSPPLEESHGGLDEASFRTIQESMDVDWASTRVSLWKIPDDADAPLELCQVQPLPLSSSRMAVRGGEDASSSKVRFCSSFCLLRVSFSWSKFCLPSYVRVFPLVRVLSVSFYWSEFCLSVSIVQSSVCLFLLVRVLSVCFSIGQSFVCSFHPLCVLSVGVSLLVFLVPLLLLSCRLPPPPLPFFLSVSFCLVDLSFSMSAKKQKAPSQDSATSAGAGWEMLSMVWSALASLAHMLFLLALSGGGDPVEDKEPVPIPSVVQSVQWSPDESKFVILDHFGSYTIWTVLQGRNFRLGYLHSGSSRSHGAKSKLSSLVDKSSRILRLTWWSDTKLALVRGNDSLSIVNSSLQAVGGPHWRCYCFHHGPFEGLPVLRGCKSPLRTVPTCGSGGVGIWFEFR